MFLLKSFIVTMAILGLVIPNIEAAATLQQMIDAGKLIRQSCQSKFKLSDEIADGIKDGNLPETKDVKCYINCFLETTKAMKRGKYQLETALKQLDLLVPDDMKDNYRNSMMACKDAGSAFKNPCDISYEILKCFIEKNPQFIFP